MNYYRWQYKQQFFLDLHGLVVMAQLEDIARKNCFAGFTAIVLEEKTAM